MLEQATTPAPGADSATAAGRRRDPDIDERIHAAARAIFAEHGYAAVTLAEVARRAGVPRSSVYRRYPSVVQMRFETLLVPVGGMVPLPYSGETAEDLRHYVHQQAEPFRDPAGREVVRQLLVDVLDDPTARRSQAQEQLLPRLAHVADRLARARDAGEIPATVDPALAARAVTGTLLYMALQLEEDITDEVLERLGTMLFGAR